MNEGRDGSEVPSLPPICNCFHCLTDVLIQKKKNRPGLIKDIILSAKVESRIVSSDPVVNSDLSLIYPLFFSQYTLHALI